MTTTLTPTTRPRAPGRRHHPTPPARAGRSRGQASAGGGRAHRHPAAGVAGCHPARAGTERRAPRPPATCTSGDRGRTPAPNFARRRLVAALVAGVAALAVLGVAATLVATLPAGFGGAPAIASEAPPASPAARYVARPGDTLWTIAQAHRGEVGQRRYLDALIELNGGTSIVAGQAVRLP